MRWRLDWPWVHAVTWRDDRRLWFASGLHPGTLHEVTADGTDAPRSFHERDDTWMHSLALTADGDSLMLVASETKGAQVLSLDGGPMRELDPDHGMIAWADTGSLSIIDRVSGETWRVDAGARRETRGATMPAQVARAGWYTRAADVVIAMRIEADDLTCRMDGLSAIDGSTRWSLPDCTSGVRCAGDATAPCVIVPSGATGPSSIRWFDPERGVAGAEVLRVQLAPGANVDVAVSPDARTLAIADGTNVVRVVTLRATGPDVRDITLDPGLRAQDVAAGARGQLYVAGVDATAKVFRILSVTDDDATIVASSATTGFYALRVSPDGASLACNTWDESRLLELLDVR